MTKSAFSRLCSTVCIAYPHRRFTRTRRRCSCYLISVVHILAAWRVRVVLIWRSSFDCRRRFELDCLMFFPGLQFVGTWFGNIAGVNVEHRGRQWRRYFNFVVYFTTGGRACRTRVPPWTLGRRMRYVPLRGFSLARLQCRYRFFLAMRRSLGLWGGGGSTRHRTGAATELGIIYVNWSEYFVARCGCGSHRTRHDPIHLSVAVATLWATAFGRHDRQVAARTQRASSTGMQYAGPSHHFHMYRGCVQNAPHS